MKIALCVKQVPDTTDIKWTEHNTIQREGVESVINPYDLYATELALKIKSNVPETEITVSMSLKFSKKKVKQSFSSSTLQITSLIPIPFINTITSCSLYPLNERNN